MEEVQSFGQWLRHRRRELDLTQVALSQAIGCTQVTIRKMEADQLRPSRQLAQLVVEKLGIPPEKRELYIRFARSGTLTVPVLDNLPRNNLPHALTSFNAIGNYGSRRAQPPESLDALLAERFPTVERHIEPDPFRAVELAKSMASPEDLVCVTGSIFLVGQVRPALVG